MISQQIQPQPQQPYLRLMAPRFPLRLFQSAMCTALVGRLNQAATQTRQIRRLRRPVCRLVLLQHLDTAAAYESTAHTSTDVATKTFNIATLYAERLGGTAASFFDGHAGCWQMNFSGSAPNQALSFLFLQTAIAYFGPG